MEFNNAYDKMLQTEQELKVMKKKEVELKIMVEEKNQALKDFLRIMEKEKKDVETLEKTSFSAILAKIAGNYDEKRDMEYQEYLDAKLEYDQNFEAVNSLKSELERTSIEVRDLESDYLEQKNHLFIAYPEGRAMAEKIEAEKKAWYSLRKELLEAKRAVENVLSLSNAAKRSFESARGWSTYDTFFRGGLIADIAKYSKIDEANQAVSRISSSSNIMNKELRDVDLAFHENMNTIGQGERFFDIAFDNIFSDWNVRSKIQNNLSNLNQYISKLESTLRTLDNKLSDVERNLRKL
ncbi:MAG: hypothetical protein WBI17_03960 [Clostridiaceae bacterium]